MRDQGVSRLGHCALGAPETAGVEIDMLGPMRRMRMSADLYRRRKQAAIAAAGTGGEQRQPRNGGGKSGYRFWREAGAVHNIQAGCGRHFGMLRTRANG